MPFGTTSRGPRVLLVEDDDGVRRSLQLLLKWKGFDVRAHARMRSAARLKTLDDVDLLVSDYALEDGDGIALLQALRESGWHGPAVLIVSNPAPGLIERAIAAGFRDVLEKPLDPQQLIDCLTSRAMIPNS